MCVSSEADVAEQSAAPKRVLQAPVNLAELAQNFDEQMEETKSIWMKNRDKDSVSSNNFL